MKQKIVITASVVIILILGYLLWKEEGNFKRTNQPTQMIKNAGVLPKAVQINLDKNGFTPQEITIKVGTAVSWKNISGDKQTVNSDD